MTGAIKKLSAAALLAVTMLMLCACSGEKPAYVGTWTVESYEWADELHRDNNAGYEATVILNEDGTYSLSEYYYNLPEPVNSRESTHEARGSYTVGEGHLVLKADYAKSVFNGQTSETSKPENDVLTLKQDGEKLSYVLGDPNFFSYVTLKKEG